jgi:hypothetical protein
MHNFCAHFQGACATTLFNLLIYILLIHGGCAPWKLLNDASADVCCTSTRQFSVRTADALPFLPAKESMVQDPDNRRCLWSNSMNNGRAVTHASWHTAILLCLKPSRRVSGTPDSALNARLVYCSALCCRYLAVHDYSLAISRKSCRK